MEKFINYSHYSYYNLKFLKMTMDKTTIQISKEIKNKISSLGVKGESYEDILKRIYSIAVKEQLREFLMSDEGFIAIEEAIKEADTKWPK